MIKKWLLQLTKLDKAAITVSLLLIMISIIQSVSYTVNSGGTDLRTRVVGARLLCTKQSPYFYKWSTGQPETLADPNDDYPTAINGLTAAPGLLYLQCAFAWMRYPDIRTAWTVFQYFLCLLIFGYILIRKCGTSKTRAYILLIGVFFFVCTGIWFYNIERGQAYIIFPFLMCAMYHLQTKNIPWAVFASGAVLAVATWCRPNFILFGLPMFLTFNKHFYRGLFSAAILLCFFNIDIWNDYFHAMCIYGGNDNLIDARQNNIHYPIIIEGVKNLIVYKSFKAAGFPAMRLPSVYISLCIYAGIAAPVLFYAKKHLQKRHSTEAMVSAGFMLYIISEYFIPPQRGGYNLIQWVFPVLLMLSDKNISSLRLALIIIALCLVNGFPLALRWLQAGGELLLVFCLALYIKESFSATVANIGPKA